MDKTPALSMGTKPTIWPVQGVKKVLDPPIIQNMAYSDHFKQKL